MDKAFHPVRPAVLAAFASLAILLWSGEVTAAAGPASPVFTRDVAPILFKRCASCHRPGQAGPFSLLRYADVKKRASQIAEVTAKGIMPPWPPEGELGRFEHDRRLTPEEYATLHRWIDQGAPEGDPSLMPPEPEWPSDWRLGKPDLVVTMNRPYTIPSEGRDLYRYFVIPIPTTERRYVRAVEFHPGNARVVHHAFLFIDPTGQTLKFDEQEAQPGPPFGAQMPDGHFLTYQPGKIPKMMPEDLTWTLEKGSYLVLQLHLNATGKPETVQASAGFYFSSRPPGNTPFKIVLTSYTIDIPEGQSDYVVADSFTLPVDVEAIAVLPHAHYLARETKAWATLPDGAAVPLIDIRNWDINWQGDYRYAQPVKLPKGSTLQMRFTYDNSANNVRNPNRPPKRVLFGLQSTDEMAELWLQVLTRDAQDRAVLFREFNKKNDEVYAERSRYLLEKNPNDPKGHYLRGQLLLNQRKTAEAIRHLRLAVTHKPDYGEAYFLMGVVYLMNDRLAEAEETFKNAIRADPGDYRSHGSLGNVYLKLGRIKEAEAQFENALRANANDATAKENLDRIRQARERGLIPP